MEKTWIEKDKLAGKILNDFLNKNNQSILHEISSKVLRSLIIHGMYYKQKESDDVIIKSYDAFFPDESPIYVCPHCKTEQGEHPDNVLDGDTVTEIDCDECGKDFILEKFATVDYVTSKI
jgi:hypothetical protein